MQWITMQWDNLVHFNDYSIKVQKKKNYPEKIQILSKKSPEFSHCTCTSAGIIWVIFYDTQFLRDKLLKKEVPFFGLVT